MTNEIETAEGRYCVTKYDDIAMRSVPLKGRFHTIEGALALIKARQPRHRHMLMVDLASAFAPSSESVA